MRILNKFSDITYALILKLSSTYDLSILAPIFLRARRDARASTRANFLRI